jgi:CRISPR-associated protein Cmr6
MPMPELAGPLSRALTPDGLSRGLPADANANLVLRRCAVLDGGRPVEDQVLSWGCTTHLGHHAGLADAVHRRRLAAARATVAGRHPDRAVVQHHLVIRPEAALLVGAGESGVRNVGFALHGTYGWPVLRGSALKGVARAYARDVQELPPEEELAIFGTRPNVSPGQPGQVTFLDATCTGASVRVARHVMTPHVGEYYAQSAKPPAEYWNPVPVEFLAVERAEFLAVLLGPRPLADRAVTLLTEALADLGVGAKTAAGYGYMRSEGARS